METLQQDQIASILGKQYIPLKEIEEFLKIIVEIPYKTQFSLKPYVDKIKNNIPKACENTKSALDPILIATSEELELNYEHVDDFLASEQFQTLIKLSVPSLMFNDELSYIASPFQKSFLIRTAAFDKLFNDEDWELKIIHEDIIKNYHKTINQAGIHILNSLYDQNIPTDIEDMITIRNRKNHIEKHYRINIKFDFIDVKPVDTLPKLSNSQINFMLRHIDDCELWLKNLPPEQFEFSGFAVGNLYEITDIKVISELKDWLSYNNELKSEEVISKLEHNIKSFLGKPDIKVGTLILNNDPVFSDSQRSLTGSTELSKLIAQSEDDPKGIFDHILNSKKILYIEDLKMLENPSKAERKLLKNKIKSYVLAPMVNKDDEILAFFELGSKNSGTFNNFNVQRLQEIFDLLKFGFEKFSDDVTNRISTIIQKNFTSIHPSVEWKFDQVARNYYGEKRTGTEDVAFDPISFKHVYPLYGQSDIVGSSRLRNKNIQLDLIDNLEKVLEVIKSWTLKKEMFLLESYQLKIQNVLQSLKEEFISTDESKIVNLIKDEIHPLLDQTANRYSDLPMNIYNSYKEMLDPTLDIIYNHRKKFEKSVSKLITHVSEFMESEESKMQKILPHFFEKYKTDGVEYNIYLGQSILKEGEFTEDDLKNFRLWQLVSMCEVSRLVHKVSQQLDVPLQTAELIFAYSNPLSIKFRMDEKKFDVDGAYNVRYEILKKRIDKAIIKNTGERLTISGKISIVYLSGKDKLQYLDFFKYLVEKNYIESEIEDLDLEKLQGAEGLKALRISVKL